MIFNKNELLKIINKQYKTHLYFDEINGWATLWKDDGFILIQIGGFSTDNFLKATDIAKNINWRPIGNSTYKATKDNFYDYLELFLNNMKSEFKINKIILTDDDRS